MNFKYWVSNLNTDKGEFAENGIALDKLVQEFLYFIPIRAIGIQIIYTEEDIEDFDIE